MPIVGNVKKVNWGHETAPQVASLPVASPATGPTGPTGPMDELPELPVTTPAKRTRKPTRRSK